MEHKLLVWLVGILLVSGVVADTWHLKENNASNVQVINDLSYWTNSVGQVGSGAPSASDEQVVPKNRTLRVGNITSKAKSVTVHGTITHDGGGIITWSNDGIFLAAGSKYSLNTFLSPHSFSDMRTINLNGTFTILSESATSPVLFQHQQGPYSNDIYKVEKLVGAAGTYVRVNNAAGATNVTVEVADASEFKGSVEGIYSNDSMAEKCPPLDNGEYGERVVFTGLDTPGKLTIGKNFVLGARPGVVTKAAEVELRDGARVEAAIAADGVSCLKVTDTLTIALTQGMPVQIFVLGDIVELPVGRYPVLTAPAELDLAQFALKFAPTHSAFDAELEADYVDNVGTLYLKIKGYRAYYADAVNGNDAWDGTTRDIPSAETIALGGTIPGPKKTLAGAMAVAGTFSTVYAAEGVYDEGGMCVGGSGSSTTNRVIVPPYVTLEAAGDRAKTVIKGKISDAEGNVSGCHSDAMRCVCLRTGAVVKGFTLADGRTGSGDSGGAVCSYKVSAGEERGLLADCVVTNCGSAHRGPNCYGTVTLLRCQLMNAVCGSYDCYQGVRVIDSLICGGFTCYDNCHFVNCTFAQGSSVWGNPNASRAQLQNTLHLFQTSGSCLGRNTAVTNSYFCSNRPVASIDDFTTDEQSRYALTTNEVLCTVVSCRPAAASVAVGKGDLALYLAATNGWPVTMQRQFTMKDIYGTDRLHGGALDLGAVQHCDFVRYVNKADGDDGNDGRAPTTAKRTLKAMMETLEAEDDYYDTVVCVAPGVYDEGEMFYSNCSNRVVVPPYVGLEAEGGPSVTTIQGKFGDLQNDSKAGAEAVRCVYLRTGAYVKGFKITGGATQQSGANAWGLYGGGVYSDGGAAVGCEITGNAGGGNDAACRGAAGFGGTYIGCYVHDNYGSYHVYHTESPMCVVAVNSVLAGTNPFYSSGDILNCMVEGNANALGYGLGSSHAWNCYLYDSGRGRAFTNCIFKVTDFKYQVDSKTGEPGNCYDPDTCQFGVQPNFDANQLPVAGSVFVDAGSQALYDKYFPEKWLRFKDVGFLGQQRVYGGIIDVGGGEYDVRGDLAKVLNGDRKLTVEAASENVTAATGGVALAPGDAIEMTFVFAATGTATFTVTGDAQVTVDGAPLMPVGGVYAVAGAKGGTCRVKVVNAGSTAATLSDCQIPLDGLRLYFR